MQNTKTVIGIETAPAGRGLDWLVDGYTLFSKSWLAWFGVTAFLVILTFLANIVPVLGSLLLQLIFPVFIGGLMLGCRAANEGEGFGFMHVFSGFRRNFGSLLVIGAVHLSGIAGILVICGVVFMVSIGGLEPIQEIFASLQDAAARIPAAAATNDFNRMAEDLRRVMELLAPLLQIILLVDLIGLALYLPLLVLVWFAPALIVLENMSAITAMKDSFIGCLKNILPYLLYGVIGLLFSIIASIPLFLGWLILTPMIIASIYLAYKDIYKNPETSL